MEQCDLCRSEYEEDIGFTGAWNPTCLCHMEGRECDHDGCAGHLTIVYFGDPPEQWSELSCDVPGCPNYFLDE